MLSQCHNAVLEHLHHPHHQCMYVCLVVSDLCDFMDCGLPGSSVHGIFQARLLEWVTISFSRGSSQSKDRSHVSCVYCIAGKFFIYWTILEGTSGLGLIFRFVTISCTKYFNSLSIIFFYHMAILNSSHILKSIYHNFWYHGDAQKITYCLTDALILGCQNPEKSAF